MSFKNINWRPDQSINNQDPNCSPSLSSASKYTFNERDSSEQVMNKISSLIVNLHEDYLVKCKNIQIYRDLSEEEQSLLLTVSKNTAIHTALAGILAIDSCVKCIDKQESSIIANMLRTASAVIGFFKSLEKAISLSQKNYTDYCRRLRDSLRHLVQQIYCLTGARGREEQKSRQLDLLEKQQIQKNQQQQYEESYKMLLGQLQRENEVLKIGIREKQTYISLLQSRCDRNLPRFQKQHDDKKTSHTIGLRMSTEKSSQNDSNSASTQHFYEQIAHLKEQLLQKNNIVIKMNEQFASEMQKYNSVFKRLQDQNRLLKRYSDIDTAYLLEELESQIEFLREEKRKDQMIIEQIQRKIQGISMTRTSRINTRHGYQFTNRQFPEYTSKEHVPYFEHRPPFQNRYSKFYSPNYTTKLSPYSRPIEIKKDLGCRGFQAQQTYRSNASNNMNRKMHGDGESYIRKSRNKWSNNKEGKQFFEIKSGLNTNLYERVISKRI